MLELELKPHLFNFSPFLANGENKDFVVRHAAALPETTEYFDNLPLSHRIFTEAKRSLGYPHAHAHMSTAFLSASSHTDRVT